MKRIAIALLLTILAASAVQAATIQELQTDVYPVDTLQNLTGVVVTAVNAFSSNGYWVAEAPYDALNGIYAYGPNADVVVGDIIDIVDGLYVEYNDLSEIKTFEAVVTVSGTMAVPAPTIMTAAELYADPEAWEGCQITISDGMMVTEIGSYGQWYATTLGGEVIMFDDYMFDDETVVLGDCYDNVTGAWHYAYGDFKMQPYADGPVLVECAVDTEVTSFDSVKSLFR